MSIILLGRKLSAKLLRLSSVAEWFLMAQHTNLPIVCFSINFSRLKQTKAMSQIKWLKGLRCKKTKPADVFVLLNVCWFLYLKLHDYDIITVPPNNIFIFLEIKIMLQLVSFVWSVCIKIINSFIQAISGPFACYFSRKLNRRPGNCELEMTFSTYRTAEFTIYLCQEKSIFFRLLGNGSYMNTLAG